MAKGTAPQMTPDLAAIIEMVENQIPDAQSTQLDVTWPADDDGIWFFLRPGCEDEVQIESSWDRCPFLIESDYERREGQTPAEVAHARLI